MRAVQVFPFLDAHFAAGGVNVSDSDCDRIGSIKAGGACHNHGGDKWLCEVISGPVVVNLDLLQFEVELDFTFCTDRYNLAGNCSSTHVISHLKGHGVIGSLRKCMLCCPASGRRSVTKTPEIAFYGAVCIT